MTIIGLPKKVHVLLLIQELEQRKPTWCYRGRLIKHADCSLSRLKASIAQLLLDNLLRVELQGQRKQLRLTDEGRELCALLYPLAKKEGMLPHLPSWH